MFKNGDIVKLIGLYKDIFYTSDIISAEQSYIIDFVVENRMRIRGLKTGHQTSIDNQYIKLDKQYYRNLKLKKICSKLETL